MRRLRAWADRAVPHDPPPDAAAHAARLACGEQDVDAGALASHARLLAERSFAVPLGTQQDVAALLGAAGARVRACAGCEDVQGAGGEVLVLPEGRTAPAGVPWTDAARILVSSGSSCWVLSCNQALLEAYPCSCHKGKQQGELGMCNNNARLPSDDEVSEARRCMKCLMLWTDEVFDAADQLCYHCLICVWMAGLPS